MVKKQKRNVPHTSFINRILSPQIGLNNSVSHSEHSTREKDLYTIYLLDAGLSTSLDQQDQKNLRDLFKAVIMNNGRMAGQLMVERAQDQCCNNIEGRKDAFTKGVGDIVADFHDRRKEGLTLNAVRIGDLLGRVLDLCRVYSVAIDPAMANVVLSTLVLEGLGRALDPDLNLIDIAMPFILGRGKV